MSEPVIGVDKYFTILAFSALISASVLIFDTRLKTVFKYLINYSVLLVSFCVIFLGTKTGSGNFSARVFASVVIFSIIYAFILLLRYLLTRIYQKPKK